MGKTPPRAELQWWQPEVSWVSIADMPPNGRIKNTKEKVSSKAVKNIFANRVSNVGTLLMSFKLTVGRVSILDINAVHNEAIISIYPFCDPEKRIQNYLFWFLPLLTQYADSKNAIKGKTLNSTSINNLLIPFPSLTEQARITSALQRLISINLN